MVYNDMASEFSTAVNVGPETVPASYQFARNRWLNLANPTAAGSTPNLPTAEMGGTYGDTSLDAQLNTALVWDFTWGKWIVNANDSAKSVAVPNFAVLQRAAPGNTAEFRPLQADPFDGSWTAAPLPAAAIELPAFSQVILIDPQACPNCLGVAGDYNQDGMVNQADYQTWRASFGSANVVADGNGDGVVDAADYAVWRRAVTATDQPIKNTLASATFIPEPHAFWLAISSAALVSLPRPTAKP